MFGMGKIKAISTVIVVFLLITAIGISFTTEVRGQTYGGEVYTTGEDGSSQEEFLEGDELYFTVELNRTEEVNLSVSLRNDDETLISSKLITTNQTGSYISADEGVNFDLTGRRAGTYLLRISHEGEEINSTYFEVLSNYAHGSSINTWDEPFEVERENFVRRSHIYYDGYVMDTLDEPLSNEWITIGLYEEGDNAPVYTQYRSTLMDGYFSSSRMVNQNRDYGDYYLNVTYDYGGDIEEQVIASKPITIYEPDFTENSIIVTMDSEYNYEKDYFFENEYLYYHIHVRDQYDWPPETYQNNDRVRVYVQKGEEDPQRIGWENLDDNGVANGSYYLSWLNYEDIEGDFQIYLYDSNSEIIDGEIEGTLYASNTFTVISMSISINPDLYLYTQGQNIEIRINSNLPDQVDISIVSEEYEPLEGAEWTDQEFVQEFWNAHYLIPDDAPDGWYYIIVNRSDDGRPVGGAYHLRIRKYTLYAETEKQFYIPGETVRAYYTVENIIDGSPASGVTVEWRVTYRNETNDEVMFKGTTTQGKFSFRLPEDARTNSQFIIDVWANHTNLHTHSRQLYRYIGSLNTFISLDDYEYLPGQTIQVDAFTNVGGVDLLIELIRDGEIIDEYTIDTMTDSSGHRTIWIKLSEEIEYGIYSVRANGTYGDFWNVDEEQFTVVDLSSHLTVHLESERGGNHYYPGETVIVYYAVTRQGEVVPDANVQYTVRDSQRLHIFKYASGGTIEFEVPEDYNPDRSGDIEISVYAKLDQEKQGWDDITIPVRLGHILLNTDHNEFEMSGDNVTFDYELLHIPQASIDSVEYRIYDGYGHIVDMGTPSENSFTFTIPQHPTDSYTGSIIILTTGGNTITANTDIVKRAGYLLKVNILTESDYTTGVFVPGQELRISYELISRGSEPLPETIRLSYEISGEDYARTISTKNTSGIVEITIPELEDGEYYIQFNAHGLAWNGRMFEVENEPSWVNRNSAISGLNQFGFIMMILLIIALLIGTLTAIIVLYRRPTTIRKREPPRRQPVQEQEYDHEEPEPEMVEEEEGYIIEEGEPEPEDKWQAGARLETDDDMEW